MPESELPDGHRPETAGVVGLEESARRALGPRTAPSGVGKYTLLIKNFRHIEVALDAALLSGNMTRNTHITHKRRNHEFGYKRVVM